MGVIGALVIKEGYYYIVKRNELDLCMMDYFVVGSLSGFYLVSLILGLKMKYLVKGVVVGASTGFLYNALIRYFVKKRRMNAKRIGIDL